jgi:hypothetical protein
VKKRQTDRYMSFYTCACIERKRWGLINSCIDYPIHAQLVSTASACYVTRQLITEICDGKFKLTLSISSFIFTKKKRNKASIFRIVGPSVDSRGTLE